MVRTLVAVNPDLASVIAMNYACQLSGIIEMGIQPLYVKEPEPGEEAPGVGWVRHTWEESLLTREREAVDRLIEAERANCKTLARPQIRTGRRDDEILSNLRRGGYDLFVEGCLASFEKSDFLQRIRSPLYRHLPCPVLIARNLIELRKVLVLVTDGVNVERLLSSVTALFRGTRIRFDLMYSRFVDGESSVEPIVPEGNFFREADAILEDWGWEPENRIAMQGSVEGVGYQIKDYSLLATNLPRRPEHNDALLELLVGASAPILIC